METAHDTARGAGLVVLNKVDRANLLVKISLGVALKEIAAGVAEDTGFDDKHPFYISRNDIPDDRLVR